MISSRPFALLIAVLAATPCVGFAQALFRSEVRLVEVHATVFDGKRYANGLEREHFTIEDNGVPQAIDVFESDGAKLTCAILLDTTSSMRKALPIIKNAMVRFIDEFRPNDSVAVYSFSSALELLQPFTADKLKVKSAILSTRAEGDTALFDAIAQVVGDLEKQSGKKTLIVFTDGDDNASSLNARAVIRKSTKAGVPVYAVAQGAALKSTDLRDQLDELANLSGGMMLGMRKPNDAEAMFLRIASDLKHTYLIAYRPPIGQSGQWHDIKVSVSGLKKPNVRAKQRYLAR